MERKALHLVFTTTAAVKMKRYFWALQIKGTERFVARMPVYHWESFTTALFKTRKHAEQWRDTQDNGYWRLRGVPVKVKLQIQTAFSSTRSPE